MFRYVGIDPGKSGALAIIDADGKVRIVSFDLKEYRSILMSKIIHLDKGQYTIWIEQVHAMPGQGVTSMFHFGENFGQICGLLVGLGLEYNLVTPTKWKKSVGVTHDKETSIIKAEELYPEAPLLRTSRSRVPDNNRAEALLIAHYARLQF